MQYLFVIFFCIFALPSIESTSNIVEMRIVDEVSNYGWNVQSGPDSSKQLTLKEKPAAFSGPNHLLFLKDRCYTLHEENYKYELCLFNNATQHERTMRWNPYSGVLGVWSGWEISNNSFVSMIMKHGDDCGKASRQVKVVFVCGANNNLTAVSEPSQCKYRLVFTTPLVCHKDSMLVYPVLNETLRKEWDGIEQDFYDKLITEKGHKVKLSHLFRKAGLHSESSDVSDKHSGFDTLETCNAKYLELQQEIEALKKELKKE